MDEQRDAPAEEPEFGPGGYLPDRASRRARKIVLRAPMGIQWVIGSLVVGVVVVVAGWLALRDTTPQPPWVEVPPALAVGPPGVAPWTAPPGGSEDAIVVRSGARTRVFRWAGGTPPVLCDASGLLEAPGGATWRVTGRGLEDTPSLAEHPVLIDDGVLWADPTTTLDPLPPDPAPADRGCD